MFGKKPIPNYNLGRLWGTSSTSPWMQPSPASAPRPELEVLSKDGNVVYGRYKPHCSIICCICQKNIEYLEEVVVLDYNENSILMPGNKTVLHAECAKNFPKLIEQLHLKAIANKV